MVVLSDCSHCLPLSLPCLSSSFLLPCLLYLPSYLSPSSPPFPPSLSLPLSLPFYLCLSPSLAVSKFFHNGSEQRTDVLHLMLDRLNNVYLRWFENQTAFKLFATSLLLVYEGDRSQPISPNNELLAIRLVDNLHMQYPVTLNRTKTFFLDSENLLNFFRF